MKWDFLLWHHVGPQCFQFWNLSDCGLGMLTVHFLNVTIWLSHSASYPVSPDMKTHFCLSLLTVQFVLFPVIFARPSLLPFYQPSGFVSSPSKQQNASCVLENNISDQSPAMSHPNPCHRGQLTWAASSIQLPMLLSLICNLAHNSTSDPQSCVHWLTPQILRVKDEEPHGMIPSLLL